MRHAKRSKLSTLDVNYSLALKHVEPIYGYDPLDPISFKTLASGGALSSSPSTLYYIPEKEVDFDSVLSHMAKQGSVPLNQKVNWSSHWLAIEGVQPAIPENPPQAMMASSPTAGAAVPFSSTSSGDPSAHHHLPSSTNSSNSGAVEVRHALSKEHQLYFETVTNCLFSKDASAIHTSLTSLRNDAGIQQLLPYFVQYLSESVMKNLKDLELLKVLLQAAAALLFNAHLFLEPYLHQLMPTLLTLAIGKRLGGEASGEHWTLREHAADLIKHIVHEYGNAYPNLAPRVLKTLLKALLLPVEDTNASAMDALVGSKYGAVATLKALGQQNVELFILPNLKSLSQAWRSSEQAKVSSPSSFHLKAIVTQAVGGYLKMQLEDHLPSGDMARLQSKYTEAFDILGEALIPLLSHHDMQS